MLKERSAIKTGGWRTKGLACLLDNVNCTSGSSSWLNVEVQWIAADDGHGDDDGADSVSDDDFDGGGGENYFKTIDPTQSVLCVIRLILAIAYNSVS